VDADPDYLEARTGCYRQQVRRAFEGNGPEPFGLTAAEHPAQLTGKDDEEAFKAQGQIRRGNGPVLKTGPLARADAR
jgi:hypothetical protein